MDEDFTTERCQEYSVQAIADASVFQYISWPDLTPTRSDAARFERLIEKEKQRKRQNWSFIQQWRHDQAIALKASQGGRG